MAFNLMNVFKGDFLSEPGDMAHAEVTRTGRRVAKLRKGDGSFGYSKTEYKNGTIVETRTTRRK